MNADNLNEIFISVGLDRDSIKLNANVSSAVQTIKEVNPAM